MRFLAALVMAMLAVSVFVTAAASNGPVLQRPAIIHLVSTVTSKHVIDHRPFHEPSPGDTGITGESLSNYDISSNPIGHLHLVCVNTGGKTLLRQCIADMRMPRGVIALMGPRRLRTVFQLVVGGGTGFYTKTRGTAVFTRVGLSNVYVLKVYLFPA